MVNEGVCNIREIERDLKRYVYYELFNNEDKPEFSNRRFYPCKKDIRNHFDLAIAERKLAKKDQDHLKLLVDEWKASGDSQDKFLFRPYVAAKKFGNEAGGSKASEEESTGSDVQTLLVLHQMSWQRRLLLRYGQDICLLDATYKTCKYALSLFFLCVKTNVGYAVVATFIIQNETRKDIEEALQIIKSWNPEWKPSFFVTDCCEAEIQAVENLFAGIAMRV